MKYYVLSELVLKEAGIKQDVNDLLVAGITGFDVIQNLQLEGDNEKLITFIKNKCDATCDIDTDVWDFIENQVDNFKQLKIEELEDYLEYRKKAVRNNPTDDNFRYCAEVEKEIEKLKGEL